MRASPDSDLSADDLSTSAAAYERCLLSHTFEKNDGEIRGHVHHVTKCARSVDQSCQSTGSIKPYAWVEEDTRQNTTIIHMQLAFLC